METHHFIQDGHEYFFMTNKHVMSKNIHVVSVCREQDDQPVGHVTLMHDAEMCHVEYEDGQQDVVNYFEMKEMEDVDIAKWIVSTSY